MFPQRSTYRPRDGVAGLGAYYANTFEQPINGARGLGACPCASQNAPNVIGALVGDDSSYPSPGKIALGCGVAAVVVLLALRIKV